MGWGGDLNQCSARKYKLWQQILYVSHVYSIYINATNGYKFHLCTVMHGHAIVSLCSAEWQKRPGHEGGETFQRWSSKMIGKQTTYFKATLLLLFSDFGVSFIYHSRDLLVVLWKRRQPGINVVATLDDLLLRCTLCLLQSFVASFFYSVRSVRWCWMTSNTQRDLSIMWLVEGLGFTGVWSLCT